MKVWAHRVTPEGESEALAATALVRSDGLYGPVDLSLTRGEAVFPLPHGEAQVEIVRRAPGGARWFTDRYIPIAW